MAATFELEITTPERGFFKEPVEMVVLPGEDGEQGILANHARMVLVVKAGTVRIQREGRWDECVIADGYAMVDGQRVLLLCQRAEWPDEIDERLAREEEQLEKEKLRQAQSMREYALAKAGLAQAMARLSAVQHRNVNNN